MNDKIISKYLNDKFAKDKPSHITTCGKRDNFVYCLQQEKKKRKRYKVKAGEVVIK